MDLGEPLSLITESVFAASSRITSTR
ncbi:hypothetical protein ACUODJ_12120 [Escherichia sp. HC-CC]